MKLSIKHKKLVKPLASTCSVVEKRQTLPILSNVLLRLEGGSLSLTGSDMEAEITVTIDGVEGDDGACTVNARKLLDICRALPEKAKIQLVPQKGKAEVKADKSRFILQTLPAKEFPSMENDTWEKSLTVPRGKFKRLLELTSFSMAQQDIRYYLNGLLLEIEDGRLRAVATNGHRLAKSEMKIKGEKKEKARQMILPRKAVLEISRLLDDGDGDNVTLEVGENHIRLTCGKTVFVSKLLDGQFPDYKAVIEPKLPIKLALDRATFHDELFRAAILANEKYHGVQLSLDSGQVQISATNSEQEEATVNMPAEYKGEKMEIAFNVHYLMDALKVMDHEQVELHIKDGSTCCTMNIPGDKDTLYLVMPMRI